MRQRLLAPLRRWWLARLPATDQLQLTQRNVYILPTGAGAMLALTLLALLIAAINYQLNLGYLLTFALAGSAASSMVLCHATLRGLQLHLLPPEPQFLGQVARLTVQLHSSARRPRYGIGLAPRPEDGQAPSWAYCDVPAQGMAQLQIGFAPQHRGWHRLPLLTAQTRFPLGIFRVWCWWQPATQLLVYPAPEAHPPPLPAGQPRAGDGRSHSGGSSGEFDGVRPYRRGDPLKQLVWKKAAQAFASGSQALVSRDAQHSQQLDLWLDVNHCGLAAPEARIARVTAWVLQAERLGLRWGLRLPGGAQITPGSGAQHQRRCLEALALCAIT